MAGENFAICSHCGAAHRRLRSKKSGVFSSYCRECHAAYMRVTRKHYWELSEYDKKCSRCRSYSRMLVSRGKIRRQNCQECGSEKSERHHPDYDNPRRVVWLCRDCHVKHHQAERPTTRERLARGRTNTAP